MGIFYCLQRVRLSAILKISSLILLFLTIMFAFVSCTVSTTSGLTNRLAASYSELVCQGDFARMRYEGNDLIIYYTSEDKKLVLPSEEYPQTLSLFRGDDIKYILKRNGDVYYVTDGLTDNIRGYIISEDLEIDMTELVKLERILTPCQYHVFHFSSEY